MKLRPNDPGYPVALARLDEPPVLEVSGPLEVPEEPGKVVAIVGSRWPQGPSKAIAHELAYHLAKAGVVVVSGGACGIDSIAHTAALTARGGRTWAVACTGRNYVYPPRNAELFERVEHTPGGRMIWPFSDDTRMSRLTPRIRNGVLVALADCVIVIQASLISGSRNAARWGRDLGRKVFVVPGGPCNSAFDGSHAEGILGAAPLWTKEHLFEELALPKPDFSDPLGFWRGRESRSRPVPRGRTRLQTYSNPPSQTVDEGSWTDAEKLVFSSISPHPTQQDKIIEKTGLGASSTVTALLTLSLKDVVVEGPDGFFRRRNAR